eukprot:264151-Pleurochrysis_carterae.AAC.2
MVLLRSFDPDSACFAFRAIGSVQSKNKVDAQRCHASATGFYSLRNAVLALLRLRVISQHARCSCLAALHRLAPCLVGANTTAADAEPLRHHVRRHHRPECAAAPAPTLRRHIHARVPHPWPRAYAHATFISLFFPITRCTMKRLKLEPDVGSRGASQLTRWATGSTSWRTPSAS